LRLLLDEKYSGVHAQVLRAVDVDASTVIEHGLAGSSDREVLAAAVARGRALLTENVADYARISAEHLTAGQHHAGVLIVLSSRFSRRPAGIPSLVEAILGVAGEQLADRVIYLQSPGEL
jgi:Domain of unknown function (DUF5615)